MDKPVIIRRSVVLIFIEHLIYQLQKNTGYIVTAGDYRQWILPAHALADDGYIPFPEDIFT